MRHLTIDVSNYDSRLHIGKQGENLTREITFDCAAWLDGLTGGALSIVHQRPSDPDAYPCGNYVTDDTSLTWSINETDVAFSGLGKCELRYTIGSRIAKTKTFYTEIVNALNPLDTPPEAWEPYIDRVIDAATQEMENMTVSASATSGEQTSVSVTKTRENDHENLAFDFTVEKGDKGEDGKSIVNVTASIDANVGTPSVTVTTSSSDAGLSVDLSFHNMKGIPGADFDTSYLPSDSATGNPATFPDGAKNVPVDELTAEIVASQDLHGYDKPWAGGSGKNICPNIFTSQTINGVTITVNDDGSIHCKGLASSNVAFNITDNDHPLLLKNGIQYAISGCPANGGNNKWLLRITNSPTGTSQVTADSGSGNTYTPSADSTLGVRVIIFSGNDVDFTFYPMVRLNGTSSEFEPYSNICPIVGYTELNIDSNGETDTIPFGQTVYGGSLNVTTGVLTISQAIVTSDQNTTYSKIPSGTTYKENSFTTNIVISVIRKPTKLADRIADLLCSYYKVSSNSAYVDIDNKSFMVRSDGRFYIWDSAFENATTDQFKAHMVGAEFVYPLANPITVQLTPAEVRTVLGNNSISANTGSVSVRYRADIGLYIDKKLA